MIYDHNLTLVVPLAQLEIAKAINRHLDGEDVGGYEGFSQRVTDGTTVFAAYSRPCDQGYVDASAMLVMIPEVLYQVCQADERFETKPSLEDCEAFCLVAECYVDQPIPYETVVEVQNV